MDQVHCGGVLNYFFATVKQIIIAKVYLWHITGRRHNRSFLLRGYHPLPLLTFTHWPRFVPKHILCHSSHSANIPTELVKHPDVCFLLTCQCGRGHCIKPSPEQLQHLHHRLPSHRPPNKQTRRTFIHIRTTSASGPRHNPRRQYPSTQPDPHRTTPD